MILDSHCHLADPAFGADLDATCARARAAGLTRALCILSADELDEVARHAMVRGAWSDVRFAAGIHPHRAGAFAGRPADAAAAAVRAVDASSAVAVGEIGLDYHYDHAPRDVQRAVFEAQIAAAVERGLPVIIHTREAADDTFALLGQARGAVRGVVHCFSGTKDDARRSLDLGLYLSFSGMITFQKAEDLRGIAAFAPAGRLLVETDAPFLAPTPHRGKRNEPAWVVQTLERLAAIRQTPVQELAADVAANFDAVFTTQAR